MNDLPPPGCSLRSPLSTGRLVPWACVHIPPHTLLPHRRARKPRSGGCKKMLMTATRCEATSGCFSLCWHRVLFVETHASWARQPWRAAVHRASKEKHLTSPHSLAPGLAFLCLLLVCCRNPHLFGLRGKERHLKEPWEEQGHTCFELATCDLALVLHIPLKHLRRAASACRGQGLAPGSCHRQGTTAAGGASSPDPWRAG